MSKIAELLLISALAVTPGCKIRSEDEKINEMDQAVDKAHEILENDHVKCKTDEEAINCFEKNDGGLVRRVLRMIRIKEREILYVRGMDWQELDGCRISSESDFSVGERIMPSECKRLRTEFNGVFSKMQERITN